MALSKLAILDATLSEIERRWPKRSVTIARVLIYLMTHGETKAADLGEALGHGRDSTAIQDCIADLATIGVAIVSGSRPKTVSLASAKSMIARH